MTLKTIKDLPETLLEGVINGKDVELAGYIDKYKLRELVIEWIKKIQVEPFPIFPDKEVEIPWFDYDEITLSGGDQIFAAKVVLQAFFRIRQEDLK